MSSHMDKALEWVCVHMTNVENDLFNENQQKQMWDKAHILVHN